MDGLPTARVPSLPSAGHSSMIAKSVTTPTHHVDMGHRVGKGDPPIAPLPLTPTGDPSAQYPTHAVPAAAAAAAAAAVAASCTNSPFSVDYLLQKQPPPDNGSTPLGFDQRTLPLHSPEHYNQTGYTHMDSYHSPNIPNQQLMSASYVPHEANPTLPSMHPSSQIRPTSVSNQLQTTRDSHMTCTQNPPQDQYTDKMHPFPLCTVNPSMQSTSEDSRDIDLPPPEKPYSPPQLVPVEEEEEKQVDGGWEEHAGSTHTSQHEDHLSRAGESSPAPVPVPAAHYHGTSRTSSSDTGEEVAMETFPSKAFQLGMSPQAQQYSSNHSTSNAGHTLGHTPPSSPPPLVPIEQVTHTRRGSASEDDDDVFFPTAVNRDEKSNNSHLGSSELEKTIEDEQDNQQRSSTASASSSNPPLLSGIATPSSTAAREDTDTYGLPISAGTPAQSLPPQTPPPPPLVVSRRGRAAGKVLDEEKLRQPISRG